MLAVLRRPEVGGSLATKALGALRNLAFDHDNAAEAVREGGIQVGGGGDEGACMQFGMGRWLLFLNLLQTFFVVCLGGGGVRPRGTG